VVAVMRCTNTCSPITSSSSYTIGSADIGAVLRLRETASSSGGSTAVWSAQYVGPVTSVASGSAVLAGGQLAIRNSEGDALAVAQIQALAVTSDLSLRAALVRRVAKPTHARLLKVRRARGIRGKLRVWACPVSAKRGQAPPPCTRQVSLNNKTVTLKLPAGSTGKVRVVVVRKRR
jgi:hypothetical protein